MTEKAGPRSLAIDAVLLAAILVILVLAGSPGPAYMSDEGNVYLQAERLLEGEWVVPYTFVDLDPGLELSHLQRGLRVETGIVPYVRHPLHAVLVTPLFGAFGTAGFVAVGILGVVATAMVSAALARLVDPRWARHVFWIVGLASPIAFHAHLWLAHSVTAAAVGFAGLAAVWAFRRHWTWGIAAGLSAAFATGLRSEALLAGPALAVMVGVMWLARRARLGPALATAGSLGLMPAAVWLSERAFSDAMFGSTAMTVQVESLSRGFDGAVNAFLITMLYSSYQESVVFWFLAASPIVLWHVGRRARITGNALPVVWTGVVIVVLLVIRLVQPDAWPIPGLWVAFPIGVLLLSQVKLAETSPIEVAIPTGAAALIWIGILATQYPVGGGLEWGGRYFAIIIPLLAPALALGLGHVVRWEQRDMLLRVALLSTLLLLGIQVGTMGAIHGSTEKFVSDLEAAGAAVSDQPRGRPIALAVDVVTLTYITTESFDGFDWMTADQLDSYPEALAVLDAVEARQVIIIGEPTVPDPAGWQLDSSTLSAFNMEVRVYSR